MRRATGPVGRAKPFHTMPSQPVRFGSPAAPAIDAISARDSAADQIAEAREAAAGEFPPA